MFGKLLFTKIDNSQLIVFRVLFGILVASESFGAILTGWVRQNLVDPKFTFNFIGFDWLQPLPGNGMYFYFFAMGVLGVLIAIGYKYRFSVISFTILWVCVYLMQKTSYNNHYYLLALVSFLMCFFPANAYLSVDAKQNPTIQDHTMGSHIKWIVVAQLFIVYTYASLAKLYADWLDFSVLEILMRDKASYPIIGELLQQTWVHKVIGISGILFDLLIVPALLWKPTRKIAFYCSIFFHLFNSVVFQIGIFPYLALAFNVFFFEPETIRSAFLKKKKPIGPLKIDVPPYKDILQGCIGIYLLIQLLLPLRHLLIEDSVLWTEEGHRMSWRMMLRSRSGSIQFKIVNTNNGNSQLVKLNDHLTKKQQRKIGAYPDFIWQFAQMLKKEHAKNGEDIAIYAINSRVGINGRSNKAFIDPEVDLANAKWSHFRHNEWILPSDLSK